MHCIFVQPEDLLFNMGQCLAGGPLFGVPFAIVWGLPPKSPRSCSAGKLPQGNTPALQNLKDRLP